MGRSALWHFSAQSLELELLNVLSATAQVSNRKVINIFHIIGNTHILSFLSMLSFLKENSLQKNESGT